MDPWEQGYYVSQVISQKEGFYGKMHATACNTQWKFSQSTQHTEPVLSLTQWGCLMMLKDKKTLQNKQEDSYTGISSNIVTENPVTGRGYQEKKKNHKPQTKKKPHIIKKSVT